MTKQANQQSGQAHLFMESKVQETYADGIAAVYVPENNMVFVDFMSLQPQFTSQDGRPVFDAKLRVIMPLNGFLGAFQVQKGVVENLIQLGRVQFQPDQAGTAPESSVPVVSASDAPAAKE